ncbi:fumarylacetoacetate hydrolase family protein [Nesterenkonia ebinurensis]|uniref:fumarylacetoacetate hydrolase family protein n=1 Tax=Nesterenkonia ebinurensis TaxID=2608252 RepID=UPI00123D3D57|nr:fumarylacetoacetate hydrolase family protein [Nesterenkonia ebinurensis]
MDSKPQFVGIKYQGTVCVAIRDEPRHVLGILTTVEEFWTNPRHWFSQAPQIVLPLDEAEIVPPVLPSARIFCVGLNYHDHVTEGSYRAETANRYPTIFGRWPSTLTVSGTDVKVPRYEAGLDWEGEVAVWIGDPLDNSIVEEARTSVVAYSVFNDLTARVAQKLTSQWTLGKNADSSGPLGPMVPTDSTDDLNKGFQITTTVNDAVVQDGNTSDMIHTAPETLAWISRSLTLRPGDILATGTPSGVGYARSPQWLLEAGDQVKVAVEGLGSVTNRIAGPAR